MTTYYLFMHVILALIVSGAAAFHFERRRAPQGVYERGDRYRQRRYTPLIQPDLLLICIGALIVFLPLMGGRELALQFLRRTIPGLFLHITLYYALLLPLMIPLRRRVSAAACAALWMLPNLYYIFFNAMFCLDRPLWLIRLPLGHADGTRILAVWFVGAAAVLLWRIASHLRFRRAILRDSHDAPEEAQTLFDALLPEICNKKPGRLWSCRLTVSPHVRVPLTVGLFSWSAVVALPDRSYTAEELSLILRHELIHVQRRDSAAKFFLTFCTAACWWNPLMWLAMRRCAADLELCCDELVLLDAGLDTRKRYASLILSEAGDERGFTTCLSSSAESLRYRLKSILEPGRRNSGGLIAGLVLFLGTVTFGVAALGTNARPAGELLPRETIAAIDGCLQGGWNSTEYEDRDGAFGSYLRTLTVCDLSGEYLNRGDADDPWVRFRWETDEAVVFAELGEHWLTICGDGTYYLPDAPDWAYIERCLTSLPPGEAEPKMPSMMIWFFDDRRTTMIAADREIAVKRVNGEEQERKLWYDRDSEMSPIETTLDRCSLAFEPVTPVSFTVTAKNKQGEVIDTWTGDHIRQMENAVPLCEGVTHFEVDARFVYEDYAPAEIEYEMRFWFSVRRQ